jgi:uncharacterized protein
MALKVNLRHLENENVQLQGELAAEDLNMDTRDELIRLEKPVKYDLEVQQFEGSLLVEGNLRVSLTCNCARCLKEFNLDMNLDPWTLHVPLAGEDAAPVNNDCVDLTPYMREDILLELPQHPLCDAECGGLPGPGSGATQETSKTGQDERETSAWAELNKLKF